MKTTTLSNLDEQADYSLLSHIKEPTFSDYLNELSDLEMMILRMSVENQMDEIEIAEELGLDDDNEVLETIERSYEKLRPAFSSSPTEEISLHVKSQIADALIEELNNREAEVSRQLTRNRRSAYESAL